MQRPLGKRRERGDSEKLSESSTSSRCSAKIVEAACVVSHPKCDDSLNFRLSCIGVRIDSSDVLKLGHIGGAVNDTINKA